MAATSLIKVDGNIKDLPGGSKIIDGLVTYNTDAPSYEEYKKLVTGDNNVRVPSNAEGILIIFDPSSTTEKRIRGGTSGGAGNQVIKNGVILLTFNKTTPEDIVYITSSGNDAYYTTFIYF